MNRLKIFPYSLLTALFLLSAFLLQGADLYDWSKAPELYPGMKHVFWDLTEPRPLKINVLRLDLATGKFRFKSAARAEGWGEPMPDYPKMKIRVKREKTRNFLLRSREAGLNMVAAVNATPWSPWCKPWNHKFGGHLGVMVSDGVVVDDSPAESAALVVTKKNQVSIRKVSKKEDFSGIHLVLPGFWFCLENGNVPKETKPTYHPRMAYGLSQDGRYLYLLAVDGRMEGISEGASTSELGKWLKHFGAYTGINMDGGGSTTMVVWDAKADAVKKLNVQKHDRIVATSLGVCLVE